MKYESVVDGVAVAAAAIGTDEEEDDDDDNDGAELVVEKRSPLDLITAPLLFKRRSAPDDDEAGI